MAAAAAAVVAVVVGLVADDRLDGRWPVIAVVVAADGGAARSFVVAVAAVGCRRLVAAVFGKVPGRIGVMCSGEDGRRQVESAAAGVADTSAAAAAVVVCRWDVEVEWKGAGSR